ncbi:uncharacterized protein LOC106669447 [Cimex lectularius]|uniref:Uncharacterized protein n=1 Tax=Cimex lectularius TaxID=79782 RepID=A0A8I6TG71_CIMLE|nr:uncharacterized protein LOC106669447 [Cimex lectularius]
MDDRCSRLVALDSLFREELSWFTHLRPGSGDIAMPMESKAMPLSSDKYLVTFKLSKEGALIKTSDNDLAKTGPDEAKKADDLPKNVMDVWRKPYGWFFLPGEKIPIVE